MKVQNRSLIFIASILLLSCTYVSHASPAVFSGTVLDKDSGIAIDGASVRIIELNMGTSTSENGFFSIEPVPDGEYTVQVTITGYSPETRKVHISGTSNFQFMLTPSPIFIDEIVSTARGIQT
ncbi:MAG TPA: carboxypeptidase-like regulatory domain-containing protein, partial [Anaerolineae bacterium]|nr:carboxypeptidase-like regulatory domain-containing protein [Anaerolineae bacterium]